MIPTRKLEQVAPVSYSPQDNLNQDYKSTFRKTAQTVFGKNNYSVIDQHFNTKDSNQTPGPGAYDRFSEFAGLETQGK